MPSINESLVSRVDMSNYSPVADKPVVAYSNQMTQESVRRDQFLRCPVPPLGTINPDNLRQFYLNNSVPQRRVFL